MSFLYPSLLWATLLVAVPIIIHLFNFKVHKVVYFSNIKFLSNIKDVSESKSKIKNLIILLCRILFIISLVIAFSGPYISLTGSKLKSKKNLVCIYLDNSFSMNAGSIYGNLFDASKERIRKILESYSPTQEYIFVTNDLEPRHRIVTNREQIYNFLNQCEISPVFKYISEINNYLESFLKQIPESNNYKKLFYQISDFQKISSDFDNYIKDSAFSYYLLPMATNKVNNLFIDSCWFSKISRSLNKQDELIAKVTNKGSEALSDIPVKLFVNGRQIALSSFSVEAGQTIEVPVQYTNTESGILPCYLEISDYPITFDNKLFFNYKINSQTSILVLKNKSENKYLSALYNRDSTFRLDQVSYGNVKTSEFNQYNVIILDEPETISNGLSDELLRFVSEGGTLVLMPSSGTQIVDINKITSGLHAPQLSPLVEQEIEVGKINFNHFLYKDVFNKTGNKLNLPVIKSYYNLNVNAQSTYIEILASSSGKPLLVQNNFNKGKVYLFCFPLSADNGDFVMHQLFVPTFYNIAAFSQGNDNLYYIAGQDKLIDINLKQLHSDQAIHIVGSSSNTDFIPFTSGRGEMGLRLDVKDNVKWADNYFIKTQDSVVNCISFNYNRKESDVDCYTKAEINNMISKNKLPNFTTISANIPDLEFEISELLKQKKEFWKLFILIAFLSLVSEILIIRLWNDKKKLIVKTGN